VKSSPVPRSDRQIRSRGTSEEGDEEYACLHMTMHDAHEASTMPPLVGVLVGGCVVMPLKTKQIDRTEPDLIRGAHEDRPRGVAGRRRDALCGALTGSAARTG